LAKQDGSRSIIDARIHFHAIKMLVVAVTAVRVFSRTINNNTLLSVKALNKLGFISNNVLSFYAKNMEDICSVAEKLFTVLGYADNENLSSIYELLLSLEVGFNKRHEVELVRTKNTRDLTGSYYTPVDFAFSNTKRAFDQYIYQNLGIANHSDSCQKQSDRNRVTDLLDQTVFTDLSCGSGEFLIAALNYAAQYSDSIDFFYNVWAYDVDPIALMICYVEYCRHSTEQLSHSDLERLSIQFIFGNVLLFSEGNTSLNKKNDLFALNRSYPQYMGIGKAQFPPGNQFDVILGNPPWERIRFEERKFFDTLSEEVSIATKKSDRARLIRNIEFEDNALFEYYHNCLSDYRNVKEELKRNPSIDYIPEGELNTYTLFPILAINLIKDSGVISLILKSGIVDAAVNSGLFLRLLEHGAVYEATLFTNREKIFPIDSRERFAVILFCRGEPNTIRVSFGNTKVTDHSEYNYSTITRTELASINHLTMTIPHVGSSNELRLLKMIHARCPSFSEQYHDVHFGRLVHLTSHSEYVITEQREGYLPVYEGKFIGQHNPASATFEGVNAHSRYRSKAVALPIWNDSSTGSEPESRYFIDANKWHQISSKYSGQYMLAWRSLTSPTNTRTMIATITEFVPSSQSVQFLQTEDTETLLYLAGLFNSIAFDYFVRLKMPGLDLTRTVINQMPVPSPRTLASVMTFRGVTRSLIVHIVQRVIRDGSSVNRALISADRNLIERVQVILDYIDSNAEIANRNAQELPGLKDDAVRKIFSQMIEAGLIEAEGENRYRVYQRPTE
jgi:hypothetical protein